MTYPHDQEYSIRRLGLARDPDLAEPGSEQARTDQALAEPAAEQGMTDPALAEPATEQGMTDPALAEPATEQSMTDPVLAEPATEQAMTDQADPAITDPDLDVVVAEIVESDAVSAGADAPPGSANLGLGWHDIQARFVDNPRDAVQLAAEAADAALKALISSLHEQRTRLLPPATDPASQDTEQLRSALLQYREFCQGIADLGGRMPQAGIMAS